MEIKIETWIALAAVIVAIVAIYFGNRNNKRQIRVLKLEELFSVIQLLSNYYRKLNELELKIEELRNPEYQELQTLSQYYEIRDKAIPAEERDKIYNHLSRLEVLAQCYTKRKLKKKILSYESMMYAIIDLTFNGGSMYQELNWENDFPDYEEFDKIVKELKEGIRSIIKL